MANHFKPYEIELLDVLSDSPIESPSDQLTLLFRTALRLAKKKKIKNINDYYRTACEDVKDDTDYKIVEAVAEKKQPAPTPRVVADLGYSPEENQYCTYRIGCNCGECRNGGYPASYPR